MKKALVYYLYGTKNAGDMAICLGAIEVLKKQNFSITMVSRFSAAEEEYEVSRQYLKAYYPEVAVYPGPFSFERDFSKAKKLLCYGKSFGIISGILPDPDTVALIQEHDVVLFNGGNLLRGECLSDYFRLMALFYPIQQAKKAGKPIYCLPQSTAGISFFGKAFLKKYLNGISKIYIRERLSHLELQQIFPDLLFQRSTDLAFFCKNQVKAKQRFFKQVPMISTKENVALILRNTSIGDIGRLDPDTEEKLFSALKYYVLNHPEKNYWIILQTKKDQEISERFQLAVGGLVRIRTVESHDPLVLRELYRHMDFTITMRLHAGILSLSVQTPVIGLFSRCWGLKNAGVMADYEMPYCVVENEEPQLERLIAQIPLDAVQKIQERISAYEDSIQIP